MLWPVTTAFIGTNRIFNGTFAATQNLRLTDAARAR